MKVIITGGTGMIGRALAARLTADGDDVVVLSRSKEPDLGLLNGRVRPVQWDSRTGQGWSQELDGADAVVNLAGANISGGRWTESRKRLLLESRLNAGEAVLDAVRLSGAVPNRVIQASGISYYGNRPDKYVTEADGPGNDFLSRVCVEWEAKTAELAEMGSNRAVIRTAPVLDLGGGALPPLVLPFLFFAGGRTGSGQQGFSWIHIDDQVEAIRFLIHNPEITGPVNMCAPEPVSNAELARAIGRTLNRPSVLPAPSFAFRLGLGEVADTILLGQFARPAVLQAAGFQFQFPTIESALSDLLNERPDRTRWDLFKVGLRSAVQLATP